MCCKLNRSIYGLVQAAKDFYSTITKYLKSIGFELSRCEPCLAKLGTGSNMICVGIYVDDLFFVGRKDKIDMIIEMIKEKFGIRVKEDFDEFIGCQVRVKEDCMILHQARLIEKLRLEFGDECGDKEYITPMSAKTHVMSEFKEENKLSKEEQTRYQSGAGTFLYLVKHSRPDLSNAVRELTKGMKEASMENYKQLLRVISYVIND